MAAVPTETFTHSATTSASVAEVWHALEQPETWEAIGGVDRVLDPVVDEEGKLQGFSFETVAAGSRYMGRATPHSREEGRVMAWKVETSEVQGVIRVESTATESGAEIEVTLTLESVGMLSSMFFPVVAGAIGNGLPKAVEVFARELGSH